MKRCKHLVTSWTPAPDDNSSEHGFDWNRRIKERCDACGDGLSLGPAADDSPEVQIEIRAAEIAADPQLRMTMLEWCGWEWASDDDEQIATSHAGYLARLIYEHK